MRNVKKTDFINNIDEYLNEAAKGEEVVIRQRNKVIARLVPPAAPHIVEDDIEAEMRELVAAGKVRPPKIPGGIPESFWDLPGAPVSLEDAVAAVVADRNEE